MPKFFCDYCDVYLTHDSMSVRKAHNSGRNHLRNVVDYYQRACFSSTGTNLTEDAEIGHEKAQSVIDSITNSYADAGQSGSNPMLAQNMGVPGAGPPGAGPPGAGGMCGYK
jgi:U1 small nuclear ribonucleoprotein C